MGMINLDRGGSSDLGGLTDGRPSDWKFVIIDTADTRYLVLGPVSKYRYHAGIVNRFCELRGVACHTVKKPALVEILDKAVTVRGKAVWFALVLGPLAPLGKATPALSASFSPALITWKLSGVLNGMVNW